jgi:hypothetical protein
VGDNLREGARISYVGDGRTGRTLGEHGRLLARDLRSGHVKWADSSITLEDLQDIAPLVTHAVASTSDDLADSLEVGPIQTTGLRNVLETEGSAGAVNALANSGHLGDLQDVADDALNFVALRIRQEPLFRAATASLEADEIDELVTMAAQVLLRDSFREVIDG